MKRKVTKAVFPVAGMGTRFLPATKSVPKEIMTLVDRPLIQYAIDEARAAGIKEFIFVTARGKSALEDYFDHAPELEAQLKRAGKDELLEVLRVHQHGFGRHRLHPPAQGAGPRPRRLVRPPPDRRRALRGDAPRRRDRRRDALPAADGRGPRRDRRLDGRGDGGPASGRPSPTASSTSARTWARWSGSRAWSRSPPRAPSPRTSP